MVLGVCEGDYTSGCGLNSGLFHMLHFGSMFFSWSSQETKANNASKFKLLRFCLLIFCGLAQNDLGREIFCLTYSLGRQYKVIWPEAQMYNSGIERE